MLRLVAETIAECNAQGKGVSVCGEMAGDITLTRLLLGLGLHCIASSEVNARKRSNCSRSNTS